MFKDMGKEMLGYAGSIDVFGTESKDYPLHKAMVNHNHQGIMIRGWGKISDESVMRSMESCRNGRIKEEGMRDSGGHVGWWFTLFCWQVVQLEMKAMTNKDRPGPQKSHLTMALVQKCPACPEVGDSCKEETRKWQADGGTYSDLQNCCNV